MVYEASLCAAPNERSSSLLDMALRIRVVACVSGSPLLDEVMWQTVAAWMLCQGCHGHLEERLMQPRIHVELNAEMVEKA